MTMRLGRYEILRPIASGGMATVHLGRVVGEGGFERLLAIKVMHPHLLQDPDFVSMFLDEARLAARIRHPNVVSTIDVQRSVEALFLVMEYVEGPTLQRLIKALRKRSMLLPLPIALRIIIDLLAGLDEAHELLGPDGTPMNIVHRDVSPSNVLVGKDGITLLTDFGVARAEARISTTRGGELKGKVPYMAPEQLTRGGPVDRRVDVYAAGVVFWEVITSQRLHRGDDNAATLASVLAGPQQSPSDLRPDLPWSIDRVCMRALEALEDRFRSAAAFTDAIEDAAAEDGIPIAKPRQVAALVRELFPAALSDSGGLHTPLGLHTPSTSSPYLSPPPLPVSSSEPPRPSDPAAQLTPGGTELLGEARPVVKPRWDTNPTTNASVVASPVHAPRRSLAVVTAAVATVVVVLAGVGVWFTLTSGGRAATAPAAPSPAVASSPLPDESLDSPPSAESPTEVPAAASASASAAASVEATSKPVGPAPRRRRTSARPSPPPPPPPPPPPTSTAFRPSLP